MRRFAVFFVSSVLFALPARSADWKAVEPMLAAKCYDEDGVPMDVPGWQLPVLAHQYYTPITNALWVEIDALKRRRRRWAA